MFFFPWIYCMFDNLCISNSSHHQESRWIFIGQEEREGSIVYDLKDRLLKTHLQYTQWRSDIVNVRFRVRNLEKKGTGGENHHYKVHHRWTVGPRVSLLWSSGVVWELTVCHLRSPFRTNKIHDSKPRQTIVSYWFEYDCRYGLHKNFDLLFQKWRIFFLFIQSWSQINHRSVQSRLFRSWVSGPSMWFNRVYQSLHTRCLTQWSFQYLVGVINSELPFLRATLDQKLLSGVWTPTPVFLVTNKRSCYERVTGSSNLLFGWPCLE